MAVDDDNDEKITTITVFLSCGLVTLPCLFSELVNWQRVGVNSCLNVQFFVGKPTAQFIEYM